MQSHDYPIFYCRVQFKPYDEIFNYNHEAAIL